MAKRIKEGDLFRIKTSKGYAYLHFIEKDKMFGELIRVLPGLFNVEPDNLNSLIDEQELFMIFFPLTAAYKRKLVELIENFSADEYSRPKHMRTEHSVRGQFLGWHIVNTSTLERQLVESLTEEQKKLSPWGIWNDTLLVERLESGWNLESWN